MTTPGKAWETRKEMKPMLKIAARDFRKKAPTPAPTLEVEYDPASVEEFDTRKKCATRYEETWGQKVEIEVAGERCLLFLTIASRSVGHVIENKNIIKDL
jgi:hypothetical protein